MKIGVVGSGKIVNEMLKMQQSEKCLEVTALCVRPHSEEKGKALAAEYQIPGLYVCYEEFLADPEVEIVYLGIVNSAHYEYARKALEAGKHVILEKPFTCRAWEARELAKLAERKALFLFEAITILHLPNYRLIRDELLERLGQIRLIQCNFSQYSSRYDRYLAGQVLPCFDPAIYGGALYDLNIYNFHFVAGLFGKPDRISYCPNLGFNGVDLSGAAVLQYPDFTAVCSAAKDSASESFAMIQGEKGYLKVPGVPSQCLEIQVQIRGGEPDHRNVNRPGHRMREEFLAFEKMFREGDREQGRRLLEHSLCVMEILEQARESAGLEYGKNRQ
ncbi:MAG: Gfo/Idh/MocA family oxidoreductase [Candidatus Limivivens sp.]|nr:Gfo/Idh/MocA family oxidoreductase [Candidatus Limivivens sp.]